MGRRRLRQARGAPFRGGRLAAVTRAVTAWSGSSPRSRRASARRGASKSSARTQSSGCRSGRWRQPFSPRPSLCPFRVRSRPAESLSRAGAEGRRCGARRCLREGPVGAPGRPGTGRPSPPCCPRGAPRRGHGRQGAHRCRLGESVSSPREKLPEADGPQRALRAMAVPQSDDRTVAGLSGS